MFIDFCEQNVVSAVAFERPLDETWIEKQRLADFDVCWRCLLKVLLLRKKKLNK